MTGNGRSAVLVSGNDCRWKFCFAVIPGHRTVSPNFDFDDVILSDRVNILYIHSWRNWFILLFVVYSCVVLSLFYFSFLIFPFFISLCEVCRFSFKGFKLIIKDSRAYLVFFPFIMLLLPTDEDFIFRKSYFTNYIASNFFFHLL